jgi:hypothetical protein
LDALPGTGSISDPHDIQHLKSAFLGTPIRPTTRLYHTTKMFVFHPTMIVLQAAAFSFFLFLPGTSCEFVDMDTPLDKRTTTSLVDGSVYHLVRNMFFNRSF